MNAPLPAGESKHAAALLEAEDRFRQLAETIGEVFWLMTPDKSRMLYISPAYERLWGRSCQSLYESPHDWIEAIHPKDRERVLRFFSMNLAESAFDEEYRILHPDGTIRWIRDRAFPVRNDDGEVYRIAGIAEDITDRRQAEDAMRRAKQKFATLVDSIDGIVWEVDAKTFQFTFVSQQAERLLGYPQRRWIEEPKFWIDHLHPEDRERAVAYCVKSTQEMRNHQFEYRMFHAQGHEVWLRDIVTVIVENGQPVRLCGIMMDITDCKRVEEKYRQIFENAVEGIYQTTPDGRFTSVNPALARMLGYASPEELIANRTDIGQQGYVQPLRREEFKRLLEQEGVIHDFQCEVYRKDRSIVWVSENARAVRDANGAVLYFEGSVEDITNRIHLELALRQSQKMDSVGQLAGGVAHDFNNILTVIQAHASQLLLDPHLSPRQAESLDHIAQASERAANLTRQLLTFSRKQVLQLKDLDLNEVVSHLLKMLRRMMREDIKLQFEAGSGLPFIHADASMMEQVLMNLAVNSRDAMPRGGELIIRTGVKAMNSEFLHPHPEARTGLFVHLSVADSGCGMKPEILSRIFEPFFTTKEVGKGTGLGLATVYGIVKQHEGWLQVQSALGRGTVFDIYLPASTRMVTTADLTPSDPPERGGTETILFVEDELEVRYLTRTLLEQYGYCVVEASNGPAALEIWGRDPARFDLLLTDMVMPEGLTGRDLANRLRKGQPKLKVIYVSGYSAEELSKSQVIDQGIHFLQKPFRPAELARAVREALDN